MKRAAEVYCTPSAVAALLIAHMHVHDVRGLHGGHRCVYTMQLHSMALRCHLYRPCLDAEHRGHQIALVLVGDNTRTNIAVRVMAGALDHAQSSGVPHAPICVSFTHRPLAVQLTLQRPHAGAPLCGRSSLHANRLPVERCFVSHGSNWWAWRLPVGATKLICADFPGRASARVLQTQVPCTPATPTPHAGT